MQELGLNTEEVLPWFSSTTVGSYTLIRVSAEHANRWSEALCHAVRRCYLADEHLRERVHFFADGSLGSPAEVQQVIIASKLPDPGPTMAGDFGEILVYIWQAASALPLIAFGPKKWRLKQDRTKPAPKSDVVHFILPSWPTPSEDDEIQCAEVKLKSKTGSSSPISSAISDCEKDRTSRLVSTLLWLKERALNEPLGDVQIPHLDRFINASDHPPAKKRFRAVAVVCSSLLDKELSQVPADASSEYELIIISVPGLYDVYNAVFEEAKASQIL